MFAFIFLDKEIKMKICRNLITNPAENQISLILDQFHSDKTNLHRGINEIIRCLRQKYDWHALTKFIENFIRNCEISHKTKICRKNLGTLDNRNAGRSLCHMP